MPLTERNQSAVDALSPNQKISLLQGYGWVSGLDASVGSSTTSVDVDLTAGTALHGGTSHSPGATTVTLQDGDSQYPRKDIIYLDSAGSLAVERGDPGEIAPAGNSREDTWHPEPPDMVGVDGTVLWQVWVPAGASESADLATADLYDRRVPIDVLFHDIDVRDITARDISGRAISGTGRVSSDTGVTTPELAGTLTSTAITDFEGYGLAVDANGQLDFVADDVTQVATGTVTATGGSNPAVDTVLQGVSTDQLLDYWVVVYTDADPAFNADYAFNFDHGHQWDDVNGEVDIPLTVNWDTDPGSGNDATLRWEVLTR